jgi:hypothetical protein
LHSCGPHSSPALEQITPGDQRSDRAVRNIALEHPEAAVGMDIGDAAAADRSLGTFDRPCDRIGTLAISSKS